MSEGIEMEIVMDPPLVKSFEEGMSKRHIDFTTAEEMTELLSMVLNDSMSAFASRKSGEQDVHLSYRPKACALPKGYCASRVGYTDFGANRRRVEASRTTLSSRGMFDKLYDAGGEEAKGEPLSMFKAKG